MMTETTEPTALPYSGHYSVSYRTRADGPSRVATFRFSADLDSFGRAHRRAWAFMRGIDAIGSGASAGFPSHHRNRQGLPNV